MYKESVKDENTVVADDIMSIVKDTNLIVIHM